MGAPASVRKRHSSQLFALLLFVSACASDPVETGTNTTTTSEPATSEPPATTTPDETPQLTAVCGAVSFPMIPPEVDGFPALDAEAQSIFDEFIAGPLSVESAYLADFDMSIAERTDDRLVLFGQSPDDGSFATVEFEQRDDAWQAKGWGGCTIVVSAPGFGSAATILDPAREPDPSSTTLHIAINERACASGQAPTDRNVVPVVVETETTIEITTLVEPVVGDANCPSNPWFPVTVELDQPIGTRTIIDMQSPPGIERIWPPSEHDS